MEFYTESQKQLQATFDSRRLAERVEEAIVTDVIVPRVASAVHRITGLLLFGYRECARRADGVT